jgi:hypothetical protein
MPDRFLPSIMRTSMLVLGLGLFVANIGACQKDSTSRPGIHHHIGRAWIIPIGVVASTTIDGEVREWAMRSHSRFLDHLAKTINPLGTAHMLVPTMAVFFAGSLLTHQVQRSAGLPRVGTLGDAISATAG